MIVINYDSNPMNSIYLTSALLYNYMINVSNNYNDVREYFKSNILDNDTVFFYSLDWLYLMGKVKKIKEGLIICV